MEKVRDPKGSKTKAMTYSKHRRVKGQAHQRVKGQAHRKSLSSEDPRERDEQDHIYIILHIH